MTFVVGVLPHSSAKLSSAQMNYPVHEIEMLAGVEAMRRHRDILLGCAFTWITNHKGLIHFAQQRNLSGRQARWLEHISEFNFTVQHVPGVENVLADALSRIYSNDQPGRVRAASEHAMFDDDDNVPTNLAAHSISVPVLVEYEGRALHALPPDENAPRRSLRERQPIAPRAALSRAPERCDSPRIHQVAVPAQAPERRRTASHTPPDMHKPDTAPAAPHALRLHLSAEHLAAESGRSETAREFSKRVRLVLHGPRREREESEHTPAVEPTAEPAYKQDTQNAAAPSCDNELAERQLGVEGASQPEATVLPLLNHLAASHDDIHLQEEIRDRYEEDPFFGDILTNPKRYKNFRVENGLVTLLETGHELLCIPDIRINGCSAREIVISHAHSLLAHLGPHKTSSLLRDHVW